MRSSGLSLDQAPPEDIPFRFFITAPLFGIFAGALLVFRGAELFSSTWYFETIALTHLFTLGWLMQVMMGALYQMVPVLVGGQVPQLSLARLVHAFLTLGILAFVGGLTQFSTNILPSQFWFSAAIILLLLAFAIFLPQLLTALFRVEANRPVVTAMRISLVSLTFAVLSGLLEVGTFAGWWPGLLERSTLKGLHVTFSLTGAVGGLIIGVGFHVIPMFYLSTPFPEKRAAWILRSGMFSLTAVALSLFMSTDETGVFVSVVRFFAMLPGMLASVAYSVTVWGMLRQRKRKVVDTTLYFWKAGLLSLPLSLLCLAANLFWPDEGWLFGFGLLFLLGFAVGITNGMLYKIVPFLIWFHRFSILVGKVKVPLLKDILPEKRIRTQLALAGLTLAILLPGVLLQVDLLIRLGGLGGLTASGLLGANLLSAIRLKAKVIA